MANKQSPKPSDPEPDPNKRPVKENAPPEDSKVKPLDPPPPYEEGGTTGTGKKIQTP